MPVSQELKIRFLLKSFPCLIAPLLTDCRRVIKLALDLNFNTTSPVQYPECFLIICTACCHIFILLLLARYWLSLLLFVVKVWQIPDEGLTESLIEPICDLIYHQKRVGLIEWHPTASNILVSSGTLSCCLHKYLLSHHHPVLSTTWFSSSSLRCWLVRSKSI